jgi:hypothetical protein
MGWEAKLTMSVINFPNVKGSNLLRQQLTLPKDFQGRLNLVFIAFEQWQQTEVDSWIPLAEELEAQVSGLVYYELPTIQSRNNVYQWFINEGMRAGIPNPKTRAHTITLYLNKITFRKALGFPNEDHIYILVIDGQGNVLFQLRGPHTPLSETYLQDFLLKQAENTDS